VLKALEKDRTLRYAQAAICAPTCSG